MLTGRDEVVIVDFGLARLVDQQTLTAAGTALGTAENPGDVALFLDYQVRQLLIDEMQDTSSAQYRMIEALTGGWEAGDGRTLYCVGDPMQSIYRFRKAEVGMFLDAWRGRLGQVELEPLRLVVLREFGQPRGGRKAGAAGSRTLR